MEPWNSSIREPLLVINSEEFTNGPEYGQLTQMSKTASSSTIFSIAGSTHPSFSDVHLILPAFINRRTGLKVRAETVFDVAIPAIELFLDGKYNELRCMAAHDISGADDERPNGHGSETPRLRHQQSDASDASDLLRPPVAPTAGSRSRSNSNRSVSSVRRHEPGSFLFHSSTQVNLTDLEEEEHQHPPASRA